MSDDRQRLEVLAEPERLSLSQLARLIDIAHDTTDPEVRAAALRLFAEATSPAVLLADPLRASLAQLREWSCPTHHGFVLETDGTRRCNFTGCDWRGAPSARPATPSDDPPQTPPNMVHTEQELHTAGYEKISPAGTICKCPLVRRGPNNFYYCCKRTHQGSYDRT